MKNRSRSRTLEGDETKNNVLTSTLIEVIRIKNSEKPVALRVSYLNVNSLNLFFFIPHVLTKWTGERRRMEVGVYVDTWDVPKTLFGTFRVDKMVGFTPSLKDTRIHRHITKEPKVK